MTEAVGESVNKVPNSQQQYVALKQFSGSLPKLGAHCTFNEGTVFPHEWATKTGADLSHWLTMGWIAYVFHEATPKSEIDCTGKKPAPWWHIDNKTNGRCWMGNRPEVFATILHTRIPISTEIAVSYGLWNMSGKCTAVIGACRKQGHGDWSAAEAYSHKYGSWKLP